MLTTVPKCNSMGPLRGDVKQVYKVNGRTSMAIARHWNKFESLSSVNPIILLLLTLHEM
jgi:hypothetical protein